MRVASVIIGLGILVSAIFLLSNKTKTQEENIVTTPEQVEQEIEFEEKSDLITVNNIAPGDAISSPVRITGNARGYWFFEASFPIYIVNWDGIIIAEGYATAESEWMTEDFVPFTATLNFTSPYVDESPDFMKRGWIILKKDNPSGLPEYDDAIELPITFTAS